MEIRKIASHKKDYLPLLLLGDEQEDMIDRYLERGTLYALFIEDAARAVCVVTDEGNASSLQFHTGMKTQAGETEIASFE